MIQLDDIGRQSPLAVLLNRPQHCNIILAMDPKKTSAYGQSKEPSSYATGLVVSFVHFPVGLLMLMSTGWADLSTSQEHAPIRRADGHGEDTLRMDLRSSVPGMTILVPRINLGSQQPSPHETALIQRQAATSRLTIAMEITIFIGKSW